MAFVSFRVRRADLVGSPDANPFGSYVRGTDTAAPTGLTRLDSDSALRADGFIVPVPDLGIEATLVAQAIDHDRVRISWTPLAIVNPSTNSPGDTNIQGIVLVYSPTGAPETVADGKIIKTQKYFDNTYAVDHLNVEAGKWAYYSLFLHWNQNGTGPSGVNWYERVAVIQELVPYDHQSIDAMWSRIPYYHQRADIYGQNDDPDNAYHGHLYRFLYTFGFEMDKTRTLIDSVIKQYDPDLCESNSINYLAKQLGLETSVEELGTSKVRQVIKDIGYYRQRKGTLAAATSYLTALSGCVVEVVESMSSPKYQFRVHAEKANLVADSLFVITSGTRKWEFSAQTASVSYTSVSGGLLVTNTGSSSAQFSIMSTLGVPVDENVDYWSSVSMTASAGQFWSSTWVSSSATYSDWGTTNLNGRIMPTSLSPEGRTVMLMPETTSASAAYPVAVFGINAGASMFVSGWMVEPRVYGILFNGSSDFGGFIYQNTFSDHQWSGSTYSSYSTYTTNRKKTIDAIERVLPKLLPVTMLIDTSIDYSIAYDWIPNKT